MKSSRMPRLHLTHLRQLTLLLALAAPSSAQVLRVRAAASPGGNGTSWSRAFNDLQLALAVAQPGDEIWVAAGTYRPSTSPVQSATFAVPDGVSLFGGFAGTELTRSARDPVANVTVLDGDLNGDDLPGLVNYGDNSFHVVTASQVQSLVLDGFTVRGGSQGGGAGIRAIAQNVELANLIVEENWGLGNNNWGGGMWLLVDTATLVGCTVQNNQATAGAGVLLRGPNLVLVDCVFVGNSGTGGAGVLATEDEFDLFGQGTMVADDCLFVDNQATSGAALALQTISPWNVELEGCTFQGGFSTAGAGVHLTTELDGDQLVARDCLFERNAACAGGALYLDDAFATIVRCRFVRNGHRAGCGAGAGGGSLQGYGARLDILDSFFFDDRRGSLWIDAGGSALVARSTFLSNSTLFAGAAIRVQDGSLSLENSIVWGAFDGQVTLHPSLGSVSATYSNVRMGGAGLPGTGNIDLDPLFVDAPAGDLHLAPGSPCIDAGNPAFRAAGADFERDSRVLDGDTDGRLRVDMGMDEHASHRLEVLGSTAPGSTLTIVTSGPTALAAALLFGRPHVRFVRGVGSLFVDLTGANVPAWPAPPSSVQVVVPPGLSGLFHTQEILVFPGGRLVPTNYAALEF